MLSKPNSIQLRTCHLENICWEFSQNFSFATTKGEVLFWGFLVEFTILIGESARESSISKEGLSLYPCVTTKKERKKTFLSLKTPAQPSSQIVDSERT